ncbi:unnamed protein product [Scytosiphon promiscuus]
MIRPAAGAASRGLAFRAAATAAARRAGRARGLARNSVVLPTTPAVSFAFSTSASTFRPRREGRSSNGNADGGEAVWWSLLAAGSALAAMTVAGSGGVTGAPSCSSAAVEKNGGQNGGGSGEGGGGAGGGGASAASSDKGPRRLTKRRSIVQEEEEREQQRGSYPSSYSAGADSKAAAAAAAAVPSEQGAGVALVVASTYNGNGPIEDRHDIRQSPRGDFFVSVLDGHGGWQAAELARKRLNIAAQTELKNTLAQNPDQVKGALTQAFLRVEREYLYQVKTAFELGFGAVARTGACAIMALVRDNRLFVANAGDCRAVLGRRRLTRRVVGGWTTGGAGEPEAVALSNDHNAKEQVEQAKLKKLHPFEGDVFTCKRPASCYVKGRLQPTRSFGDAYLKYPEFNGKEGTHRSAGRFLPPPYTPPYITAEPEISVHEINTTQDDFVVLASDGLWDHVSNIEAVEIVRKAAYDDGVPESAGDRLVQRVLERAAENHGISVEELQEVPEGNRRRSMHDDITCVVFFLNGNRNNEGFAELHGTKVQGKAAAGPGVKEKNSAPPQ